MNAASRSAATTPRLKKETPFYRRDDSLPRLHSPQPEFLSAEADAALSIRSFQMERESPMFICAAFIMKHNWQRIAGVVARVEGLRGRMSEAERQALGRACRDSEGLFESLLVLSFVEGLSQSFA